MSAVVPGVPKVIWVLAFVAIANVDAQARSQRPQQRQPEAAPVATPADKRDSLVSESGTFNGRPYWQGLAQCGGIYFKLNVFYTDVAVRARVVKPDPKANAEYTKELNEAPTREASADHDDVIDRSQGHAENMASHCSRLATESTGLRSRTAPIGKKLSGEYRWPGNKIASSGTRASAAKASLATMQKSLSAQGLGLRGRAARQWERR